MLRRRKVKCVLDLGCGAGRHCVLLAKNGFEVVGVDVSDSALKMAKKRTDDRGLENTAFLRAAMTDIPIREGTVDAVVSVSVIHHAVKKDIAETVDEILRVLRKGGLFLANLASVNDRRYGDGERIEEGTYRILEVFKEKWFEEVHHFFTRDETAKMLAPFAKSKVEVLRDRFRYWKVTAVK